MPFERTDISLTAVALCHEPANPGAKMAMWKSADPPADTTRKAAPMNPEELKAAQAEWLKANPGKTKADLPAALCDPVMKTGDGILSKAAALFRSLVKADADPAEIERNIAALEAGGTQPSGATMPKTVEELNAELTTLRAENAGLKTGLEAANTTVETQKSALSALQLSNPNAKPEDLVKSIVDPTVRALVQKSLDESAALRKSNEELAKSGVVASFTKSAEIWKSLTIEPPKVGDLLYRVSVNKATPEDVTELQRILTSANEIAKKGADAITKSTGGTGGAPGARPAYERVMAKAGEMKKSAENAAKSHEQLVTEALRADPKLYQEYREEEDARRRAA